MASLRPPTHKNDSFTLAAPPPPISSPTARITPAVLFIIVILAVILFVSGLLYLLVRFISCSSSSSRPADPIEHRIPAVDARQLQQLFHLQDSGVDQSLIDSLPVFSFRSVAGPRRGEAFDCAVCLSEFDDRDRLRLLPNCGHAFHLSCIDTWLLTNSTCPLCRGNMLAMDDLMGIMYDDNLDDGHQKHDDDDVGDHDNDNGGGGVSSKVLSVKLGKFRNLNGHDGNGVVGESSGSAIVDGRRCFSMGSSQYVVGEPSLGVKLKWALRSGRLDRQGLEDGLGGIEGGGLDLEGKRLSWRSRGDSFSISKIWLWGRREPLMEEKHVSSCTKDNACNGV